MGESFLGRDIWQRPCLNRGKTLKGSWAEDHVSLCFMLFWVIQERNIEVGLRPRGPKWISKEWLNYIWTGSS